MVKNIAYDLIDYADGLREDDRVAFGEGVKQ
jgi:hypothetical protein